MTIQEFNENLDIENLKKKFQKMSKDELLSMRNNINLSTVPECDFVNQLKLKNFIDMELGIRSGWWSDWNKKEPISKPIFCDFDELIKQNVKFMSQLLVRLECFDSVSEAKKSGWIMPLKRGEYNVKFNGFQKLRIIIE